MKPSPTISAPLFDAYAPAQIAVRVRDVGVAMATPPVRPTLALAVLAGAGISLGAVFYPVTVTSVAGATAASFGLTPLAGGVAFSLGLILVVVGEAELFTGNNLIAMAWAAGRPCTGDVLRHWAWVYAGNLLGALVSPAGVHQLGDGAVGETAVRIARAKAGLDPVEAGARGEADKILATVFPISAFVARGFEHSVANMIFSRSGSRWPPRAPRPSREPTRPGTWRS